MPCSFVLLLEYVSSRCQESCDKAQNIPSKLTFDKVKPYFDRISVVRGETSMLHKQSNFRRGDDGNQNISRINILTRDEKEDKQTTPDPNAGALIVIRTSVVGDKQQHCCAGSIGASLTVRRLQP